MLTGEGFFRARSRPARDLGVLLVRQLTCRAPLRVLDLMAGCGIRSIRYGLEGGAGELWANDADPERLPLLQHNLLHVAKRVALTTSSRNAQQLLAEVIQRGRRFSMIDLDAFGCPAGLIPLTIEALAPDGVLYLTSSDGRTATGHDRSSALRRYGAAVRVHPASWEMALRLQLGMVARSAWVTGRGLVPLFSFSDGRTFRTAIRITRRFGEGEDLLLGLVAHCPTCGDQQVQSLLRLGGWAACLCASGSAIAGVLTTGDARRSSLAISGPLWIGPLQCPDLLDRMRGDGANLPDSLCEAGSSLLERLAGDRGSVASCWSLSRIGRQLRQGPPALAALVDALRNRGHGAWASGIMPGQLRSDAPWPTILSVASTLGTRRSHPTQRP